MAEVINQDARIKKSADAGRGDRASEDVRRQENDGTAYTVSERRQLFRNEWTQEALPTPPELPGFHMCWLSSTNSYDPINKRIRMGYSPVKVTEVAGFEHLGVKTGDYEGMIACNEMLLFKIPNEIYQEIMQEFHYHMPLEEEQRIKESAISNQRDSNGKTLGAVEGDGFNDFGVHRGIPTFS